MIKSEQASLSVTRIAVITILIIFALTVGVFASSTELRNVKIVLSDNCEIEVFTTKTVVSDILDENHIIILPEENVVPNLNSKITENNSKIVITGITQDPAVVASLAKEGNGIVLDKLLSSYSTITEKMEVNQEEIEKADGKNDWEKGIKELTYKVKYQNDIEIGRELIKEEVIKQPTKKIVVAKTQSNTKPVAVTSRSSLSSRVEGITPEVKTLNASAYTASTCGKSPSSPSYGITANGAKATAWYTVAAGKGYPFGTIIYIPYFSNMPNGGWFVVQDRGGAISNNKLDVYMNTYNECIQFGRRNLECYIYKVN